MTEHQHKVTASHLSRKAYLYVRQSTLRQVLENQESTQRQYALRSRALALGWPEAHLVVIDNDQGQSGASAVEREGFQTLVAEVGMGRAGIVLGLEVSRLARNCADWHRLLEICSLSQTLIMDEDGLYDPGNFNDRLLLGMKGTMSEAELHMLRARLRGGMLNKARRGELKTPLPVGLIHNLQGRVTLDPDLQVQEVIRYFFVSYRMLRSAHGVVKLFRNEGLHFPRRPRTEPGRGELFWVKLTVGMAVDTLHNPRYAGAFVFGRRRGVRRPDGSWTTVSVAQDEWTVLLQDAHAGYISWEEFQENRRCLGENAKGANQWPHRAREGPALLQGIALCGVCGSGMTPRYHVRSGGESVPSYICTGLFRRYSVQPCQSIPGQSIDEAIGQLLLNTLTPLALETALAVQQELQSRLEAADRLRLLQVERAQYEVDLARRRYLQVDPDNRLVAELLEADWNARLRQLRETKEEYERQRAADQRVLNEEQKKAVCELASDFPRVWNHPDTPPQERKRMLRLLLEDVTLTKAEQITVQVRFRGGASCTLTLPAPERYWQIRKTSPEVVNAIDKLLDDHTEGAIAELLNERGMCSGQSLPFNAEMVRDVRRKYQLKSRFDRLRAKGLLTTVEMAARLGISTNSVTVRRSKGQIQAFALNDKGEYLYEANGQQPGRQGITRPDVILALNELLEEYTDQEAARILNERGLVSGEGKAFTSHMVERLRRGHGLLSRYERLRKKGLLTSQEVADKLGLRLTDVLAQRKSGLLKAYRANDRAYLFDA